MENISVKITKLGKIRDSVIDVSQFVVFSGESGLGKSYLSLVCFYFFNLLTDDERLNEFFVGRGYSYNELIRPLGNDSGSALMIRKRDLELWMSQDIIKYLNYMLGYDDLKGEIDVCLPEVIPDEIQFDYRKEFLGVGDNEDIYTILSTIGLSYRFKTVADNDESPFSYLLRFAMVKAMFGDYKNLNGKYVFPPSRGFIMSEKFLGTTGLYQELTSTKEMIEKADELSDDGSVDLKRLFETVMDGDVQRRGDKYIYKTSDGAEMPISAAAASVREISLIQQLIKKRDISKVAILLEEPESHLHPLKQRMMADIIACMINAGTNLMVTTHSDYLLKRLNELMLLDSIKDKYFNGDDSEGGFVDLCNSISTDPKLAIPCSSVSAYLLKLNEDGSVSVEKQQLDDGIPFSSFRKAISDSLDIEYLLENYPDNE